MTAFARLCLFSPSRAAQSAKREDAWKDGLAIYAIFLAASAVFFWLKPADFPDVNAPIPIEHRGLGFWLKVGFWQLPLEAGWILFLAVLARFFSRGSWPVRFAAAVLWTAFPFLAFVAYGQGAIPRLGLHAAFLVWLAPMALLARRLEAGEWRPLAAFILGMNAIGLALLAPMAAAALFQSASFFTFSQALGGLWMLAFASLGLRELSRLRLPRAFMAVLFSMFLQIALAFHLHLGGLVPKEILKALFYA